MPGAWYIHNNDYCQICMYHSFSPFWFSLHFYVSSQKPNLRHIGKKAHHLASITRLIIFAVRPFALFGRVRGKPAAISSHQQRLDCALFSVPMPLSCIGRLFVSCFHCYLFFFTLYFVLLTMQRYKHICECARIWDKIFVLLTFLCYIICLFTYFRHKNGKMCNNLRKFLCSV